MRYEDFIAEVRHVVEDGSRIVDGGVESHEHPAFRAWRHTAESLVANIRAQGFKLPGAFKSRHRTYRVPWVNAGREDDGDRFRRDMHDSLIELGYLVDQFERYGKPAAAQLTRRESPADTPREDISSEKITLTWMRNHIPASFWFWGVTLYAAVFFAGFLAGRNDFFQKTYDLFQGTFLSEDKQ